MALAGAGEERWEAWDDEGQQPKCGETSAGSDERDTMSVDESGRNLDEADKQWLDRMKAMSQRAFPEEHRVVSTTKKKRKATARRKQTKIKCFYRKTK